MTGGGNEPPTKPQLPRQHPAPHQRDGKDVQDRGLVQVAGKGLLARLMPKQCTAGISADGPPQKRPSEQRPFGHPPRSRLRTDLVKTEQHERPQIDQRKQAKGIGEGEEGREVHEGCVCGLVGVSSGNEVPRRCHCFVPASSTINCLYRHTDVVSAPFLKRSISKATEHRIKCRARAFLRPCGRFQIPVR